MKKITKAVLGLLAGCALLEGGLQVYVQKEEKKRAEAEGNSRQYDYSNLQAHQESVLKDKKILFLGSSVTYGAAAQGQSFVELFEKLDGVQAIKEAKSGTTLVDEKSVMALVAFGNGDSYVKRLKKINADTLDCVVCQLSTNDATMKKPLGIVSAQTALSAYDTKTITGAMEYIIQYCKEKWNCPVVFYTGSYYDSAEYSAMVQRLHDLQKKWDIGIIDLYTDEEFNNISKEQYALYMFDPIHPTRAGYSKWWMPRMEAELIRFLAQ